MAKGNAELKDKVAKMELRLRELEVKNEKLEEKVAILESRVSVAETVSSKLVLELDRLDQYHRRPNIIMRKVFLPENETLNALTSTVTKVIGEEINLPNAVDDIDKFHRVGRVKTVGGKKHQDIIIRFKTHRSRYAVYQDRKKSKSVKISPNLTKRRGALLYEASQLVNDAEKVNFVFANVHGDLNIRLVEPYKDKMVFPFSSMGQLKDLLAEINEG